MGRKTIDIFGRKENNGFVGEVVFPGGNRYDFQLQDPFLSAESVTLDKELCWYFERYLDAPYIDGQRKKRAETSITDYGESLFTSVFKEPRALMELRDLITGFDELRIRVVSKEKIFQALHWEAMKDPTDSQALCLSGVQWVRSSTEHTLKRQIKASASLNVLMVTARPGGGEGCAEA